MTTSALSKFREQAKIARETDTFVVMTADEAERLLGEVDETYEAYQPDSSPPPGPLRDALVNAVARDIDRMFNVPPHDRDDEVV